MLNLGITSRSFNGLTISDTAERMAAGGFRCTELCFVHPELPGWTYNGIGSLEGITPARVKEAAREFTGRGIAVTSLGIFTDLRNPDPDRRAEIIDYARRYIEFAAEAGIPYLASECGFTPGRRGINTDTYETDYENIKATIRPICLEAEKCGVHLALEACVLDILPSPRRLKTLIEELEEESHIRLGAMLDPAAFHDLAGYAHSLGLRVLGEVHCEEELATVADADLLGVNARDLRTFSTSLEHSAKLIRLAAGAKPVIAESAVKSREDMQMLVAAGASGFLIGETLMRAAEPGEKLREMIR